MQKTCFYVSSVAAKLAPKRPNHKHVLSPHGIVARQQPPVPVRQHHVATDVAWFGVGRADVVDALVALVEAELTAPSWLAQTAVLYSLNALREVLVPWDTAARVRRQAANTVANAPPLGPRGFAAVAF